MKSFNRVIAVFCVMTAAVFAAVNFVMLRADSAQTGLRYVEVSRAVREISESGKVSDISGYETLIGIYEQTGGSDFYEARDPYVIREINGVQYRIEYKETTDNSGSVLTVNIIVGIFALAVLVVLLYIRHSVIKPFTEMTDMPYELAKGRLTTPLKESRSRYFGKFLWGLDMLREELEKSKKSELELQKEKKTMLMSLSHDIKTPLSAIKLYSKALSNGIYTDSEKQKDAAGSINAKADEIEQLVSEIMRSGTEDIMRFEVTNDEFYLSGVIDRITTYYRDRLNGTELVIENYSDCIINGDGDRLAEVLQNIMENAIKYGDGRRISLSFADEEDCRLVTVSNSGCSLPAEELAHIFDSFWRGSNAGSESGSGLGLYICRQLMSAMGGDVFAEIKDGDMRVTAVCRKK